MENILVYGSSLAKQVVQHNDRNGRKIDNILFKGKINLKSIDSTLRDKNKQYKKVIYLSGNDLLPSKLHKINNKTHVCLDKFDESKCSNIYSSLVGILSLYTKNIVFVEPPPRATSIIENSECLFYDKSTANRFRKIINSLKSDINIGVFSNSTLLGFLSIEKSPLCSLDQIHFSKQAIAVIQRQVIEQDR